MRKLLIFAYLCFSFFCFSQKAGQKNALFTIRGNIGIPKVISSQMFRTSFTGIYEGNLSLNLRLFDNIYIGVGYQNTQFQNNKFLKEQLFNTSIPYNTRLLCSGMFFKIGYDKFFSEKGYFSYALNSGYMLNSYLNVNADTSLKNRPYPSKKFSGLYLQPEVSANFGVEDNISFSLMLSYTTLFHRFDARAPRFNQFEKISKASNKYLMAWICFGVGFNILINR